MITSKLTSKAQTTIPQPVRAALRLGPGDEIAYVIEAGRVVLTRAYTNRPVQQRRPALVIAVPDAPGASALLWVLLVTSAANRGWPGDVLLSDLAAAGLPAASVVRSAKITTIEVGDAERIGSLPPDDRLQVLKAVRGSLARFLANRPRQPKQREHLP